MKPAGDAAVGTAQFPARLHAAAVLLLLVIVMSRLLVPAVMDRDFGIAVSQTGGGWTSDFAAHVTFAAAFWRGKAGYDVPSHLRITSERAGRTTAHALPFGYSPTMLWILGPFCLLPAAWAYVVWTLLGIISVWWIIHPKWAMWLAAAFFTPAAFTCFKLGQTAFFTVLGLFVLMFRDLETHTPQPEGWTAFTWLDGIILWGLTAKPPLALTGGIVLLAVRQWQPVAIAAGLSLLSSAALTPLLGISWPREYLGLLTHYDLSTADPAYAWSLVPETMGNLRALLHVVCGIGDSTASQWSGTLWLFALVGTVSAAARQRLAREAAWGFSVLAYLLLCPHVTSTDELHVVLILALFTCPRPDMRRAIRWIAVISALGVLCLAPGLGFPTMLRVLAVFAGKLLLVGLIWARWVQSPRRHALRLTAGEAS